MKAPMSKRMVEILNNPLYAQKISEALTKGKPVVIIHIKGKSSLVSVQSGYPTKKDITDYPPEDVIEVNLD